MMKYVWGTLIVLLCCAPLVQAQECASLVQEAIDLTNEFCSTMERNQACYGNLAIDAIPQPDAADFKFEEAGDIVNVSDIQSLNLSAMTAPDEWGVALMSLQADLPDTVPGQNVTVLLFGGTSIENAGAPQPVTANITVDTTINVRSGPGTSNRVLGQVSPGGVVVANGRNEAGDWLRVQLADSATGWVSAELVTIEGDASELAVVETTTTEEGIVYAPMQAFYFSSGVGAVGCTEAPQDGIIVQTPDGVGEISLLINEVSVELGSTAYIRGQSGGSMIFDLLEGMSKVTVGETTVSVLPGTRAEIPLDAEGHAAGDPVLTTIPEDGLSGLEGVITLLPKPIELPEILTEAELAEAQAAAEALANAGPEAGSWQVSDIGGGSYIGCVDYALPAMETFTATISPTEDGFILKVDDPVTFVGQGGGIFTAEMTYEGMVITYTFTMTEPGLMTGEIFMDMSDIGCSITWHIQSEKK